MPQNYREKVRHIYMERFLVLALWMIFSLGVVAVVSLVPSYTLIHLEKNTIESKLTSISEDSVTASSTGLSGFEKEIDDKLVYINSSGEVLRRIDSILALRNKGIVFELLSIDGEEVTIGGKSQTRSDLSEFNSRLKKEPWVKGVSLPIQVFAEDKDISFNAVITIKADAE